MSDFSSKVEEVIANTTDYCFLLDYGEKLAQEFEDKLEEIGKSIAKLTPVVNLIALLKQASDLLEQAQKEYDDLMLLKDLLTGAIAQKLLTLKNELKAKIREEVEALGQDINNFDMNQYCHTREL